MLGGTKVVRIKSQLPASCVFTDSKNNAVQSIMGAQEKRREMAVGFCIENAGKKFLRILSAYAMPVRFWPQAAFGVIN